MTIRHLGATALAIYFCLLFPTTTQAATGTLYQNTDDSTGQTDFSQSSGSMSIDGTLQSITGLATGGSYSAEIGAQTNPGQAPATESPGGGGGAGRIVGTITLDHQACTVSYSNLVNLTGTKTSDLIYMFLSGQLNGFYFPDSKHWQRSLWLTDPTKSYDIFGRTEDGHSSNIIQLQLSLRAMGDLNADSATNEYDLSLLTAAWEKLDDCTSDLNRDGITDEYDLSLLISNWHD